jgi:hypothetical protein
MAAQSVSLDEKITLWTCQSKIVLNTINEKGVYHVKKEYIYKKYEEVSNIFLEAYNWFVMNAQKIVPRSEGSEYPIWLFTDLKYVDHHKGYYILQIEVDSKNIVLFDREKWNRILNLSYVPKNSTDDIEFKKFLEKQGINDETDIFMKSYYPALKSKVKKSWDRLFDNSIILSESRQASLWEIRKEWVTRVIEC